MRCIGLSVFTALTLIFGGFMELSHMRIWSTWMPEKFAPHYSEVLSAADTSKLDTINAVKTGLFAFIVVFSLLLRCTHYILLPVVSLVGSPIFAAQYCKW